MQRSLVTVALAEALLASITAAHRQDSPHVDTPGLCTALAVAVGVQNIAATGGTVAAADVMAAAEQAVTGLARAINKAADTTLDYLRAGIGDDTGLSARDLMTRSLLLHTSDPAADDLFGEV